MTNQDLQSLKNKYDIIGNDPALNRALEIAVAVAPTDITVLVTGESGVGKENIPRIIHNSSPRKRGKYFAINCGAIPEGTIDSELFGHEKGSFTGANEMRRGYFEEADGGTIFLDEIAEMPMASQAKLLRVLQSGEFIRVGSSKVLKTDVRVIAATNVNLMHAVSKGKFREDLYYRLNAVTVMMPSLRERPGDINLLFRKFASDFSAKYGFSKVVLTEDASILLRKYRWPGNIRQLKNVAEAVSAMESMKMSAASDKCVIDVDILSRYIPREEPNLLPAKSSSYQDSPEAAAEREGIDIKTYSVIYDAINDVEAAMKGMLDPVYKEVVIGTAEIRQTFKVSNVGTIAGSYVLTGKVARNAGIRVIRDNIVIHDGKLVSLKRFKDDVKEVDKGYECGLQIDGFNDIKEGDQLEVYIMEQVK